MAYKIHYSPESKARYPVKIETQHFSFLFWLTTVIVLASVIWIRFNGLPDFLIPGDPQVTKAAASMMIDKMQSGSTLNDALTVFCKEILHGAGF